MNLFPPRVQAADGDHGVTVEDALSARRQKEDPLFKGRIKVYPKQADGTFRRLKWTVLAVLLAIYYVVPWLRWDRGPGAPDQAVLIDLANTKAYFLWIEIWPQELYYLVGLLLLAAIGLFLVTSLLGRVWCGYTCPQTVWTDLFMWVERLIEGDRGARMRLDAGPVGPAKVARKAAKHGAWLLIAFLTGGAWIMYFNDAPTVVVEVFTGQASATVYFFIGLFTATTYLLAGWAREQVCTYMCPWPRFQSAMFDEDTLIVTYQKWRGEPRGPHKKGTGWEGRGHCVDCNNCVAVCPMGIDIRDGSQLECITCALCIDACAGVMDRVGLPRGLIAYDTQRNQDARAAGRPTAYSVLRPRTIFYVLLFVLVGAAMVYGLASRSTLGLNVLHERNPLYVPLSDGGVRNSYTVKVLNMLRAPRDVTLEVVGLAGAELQVVGSDAAAAPRVTLGTAADSVASHTVHLRLPPSAISAESMPFKFRLSDPSRGETAVEENVFRAPAKGRP